MSTKKKKLYSKQDLQAAKKDIVSNSKRFRRKGRVTVQVRVDKKWHDALKKHAKKEGLTISKLLDRVCKEYHQREKYQLHDY